LYLFFNWFIFFMFFSLLAQRSARAELW